MFDSFQFFMFLSKIKGNMSLKFNKTFISVMGKTGNSSMLTFAG